MTLAPEAKAQLIPFSSWNEVDSAGSSPPRKAQTLSSFGDDSDDAEADAFLEILLPDGTTLVTCDPTNLKTTKVAKGDCEASEGGFGCDYVVTITNMGPDPFKGPIKISEQVGFAPKSVSFSAPW
ncbi:MAG TPA: hypothetical protein VFI85_08040, partial [Methyloceanibacter sp.]|nr:hypothetical protein [Methyloceanibacter sp.]